VSVISTSTTVLPDAPIIASVAVVNQGGQAELDACLGGLTLDIEVSNYLVGKFNHDVSYYTIHEHCGGSWILNLQIGDRVIIENQKFKVTGFQLIHSSRKADAITLAGSAFLQTCLPHSKVVRVVSLNRTR